MQRWEYLELYESNGIYVGGVKQRGKRVDILKQLGVDGWELVSTIKTANSALEVVMHFKRPLP